MNSRTTAAISLSSFRSLALVVCLGVAAAASYGAYRFQSFRNKQRITKAEVEVYEAIIRQMLPNFDEAYRMRLVLDDRLLIDSLPPGDFEACRKASVLPLRVAEDPPSSDNASREVDGVVARDSRGDKPGEDVTRDYQRKRCIGGLFPRSLQADVPHNFFQDYVRANDRILPGPDDAEFARLFPGAPGVLGFSQVGLNKQFDEAIVSSSFFCGGLCGSGHRYFLKKVDGQWKVVSSRTTWVS